mgnify:CR=1 FL=1
MKLYVIERLVGHSSEPLHLPRHIFSNLADARKALRKALDEDHADFLESGEDRIDESRFNGWSSEGELAAMEKTLEAARAGKPPAIESGDIDRVDYAASKAGLMKAFEDGIFLGVQLAGGIG